MVKFRENPHAGSYSEFLPTIDSLRQSNSKEVDMGDKGKKDSVRREGKKKPKLTLKEKRKKKKEKKK